MNKPSFNSEHDALAWEAFRYVADEMSLTERNEFEDALMCDLALCDAVAEAVQVTQLTRAAIASTATRHSDSMDVACDAVLPQSLSTTDGANMVPPLLAPATSSGTHWWLQPVAWMAIGAAACLLAMFILIPSDGERNARLASQPTITADFTDSGPIALAYAQQMGVIQHALRYTDDDVAAGDAAMHAADDIDPTYVASHDAEQHSSDDQFDVDATEFDYQAWSRVAELDSLADEVASDDVLVPSWLLAAVTADEAIAAQRTMRGGFSDPATSDTSSEEN